jgi:predicted CXXCH cytochrome family protein
MIGRRLTLGVAFLLTFRAVCALGEPPGDRCAACHRALAERRLAAPAQLSSNDIHRSKGFGCSACHGGDPQATGKEGMDRAKGYLGTPSHEQIPQICARCHADAQFMRGYNPGLRVDQFVEYRTSVHGRRLIEQHDQKVATCSSCHTAHAIRPVSDPRSTVHPLKVVDTCGRCHGDSTYMAGYDIPTDQLAQYKRSVHWSQLTAKGDLSAPTCNDCHGNHGATPPGVASVGNLCAQCHSVQGDMFERSRHREAFAAMGTPGCATCHSNHEIAAARDAMLGLNDAEGALCATCHAADDPGGKAAVEMRALIDRLRNAHEESSELLTRAERSGMEVSQAQFDLNGATDALVKARAAVHAFAPDAVRAEVRPGLDIAMRAHARAERALAELGFRRRGLFASLVIIGLVIVGLVLKIREIEGPHA